MNPEIKDFLEKCKEKYQNYLHYKSSFRYRILNDDDFQFIKLHESEFSQILKKDIKNLDNFDITNKIISYVYHGGIIDEIEEENLFPQKEFKVGEDNNRNVIYPLKKPY